MLSVLAIIRLKKNQLESLSLPQVECISWPKTWTFS